MTAHSIRSKLVKRLSLVLVIVAVTTNTALYFYLRDEILEQYDDSLLTEARAVASVWRPGDDKEQQAAAIIRAFPQLKFDKPNGDYLKVVHRDGSTVLHVPPAADHELERPRNWPTSGRRRSYDLTLPDGRDGRAVVIAVEVSAHGSVPRFEQSEHSLILAEGRQELNETLAHLAWVLVILGAGLTAASICMVVIGVRRGLRPLSDFSESVGRLDADSLDYRFPTDRLPGELRPISTRLNELLGRLQSAFSRERRFTENVAHELRTPLAELRSMIEVAMKWPPEPAELSQHHNSLLEVVKRMSAVVQQLLALLRSDPARLVAAFEPVDLISCLRAAWSSHEHAARRRGVGIAFECPERQMVVADADVLLSLLDNLFGNAAAYATSQTMIKCVVTADDADQNVHFSLANANADLTDEDLGRLEEPFWRKDAARSPGDRSGLGLALVREYATALNVSCRYSKPTQDRFMVELTLLSAQLTSAGSSMGGLPPSAGNRIVHNPTYLGVGNRMARASTTIAEEGQARGLRSGRR